MGNCGAKRRAAEQAALLERRASLSSNSLDSESAGSDLYGAGSGYGGGDYVYATYCPEGIPEDVALLATAAALAAGIYVVYRQITIQVAGRKRRSLRGTPGVDANNTTTDSPNYPSFFYHGMDVVYSGLEEFENKVDKIAAGQEENSWISGLYKRLSENFGGTDDKIAPDQMDGMEPPILDETWGLRDIDKLYEMNNEVDVPMGSNSYNSTTELDNDKKLQLKSNDDHEDFDLKYLSGDEKCNSKFWRCIGKVAMGSAHYLQEPGGLTGFINKNLFKIAFHGGFGNVWGALMSIPEARQVKKCMNQKDECLSFEILRKEANATSIENARIIVNPEFVENLDDSDGANQFDPEDQKRYDEAMAENEVEN